MSSLDAKRSRFPKIIVAFFMIGLIVGAAGAFLVFQTQLAQVTSEFEKGRPPRLPAFTPVTLDSKSTALLLLDFMPPSATGDQCATSHFPTSKHSSQRHGALECQSYTPKFLFGNSRTEQVRPSSPTIEDQTSSMAQYWILG